MERSNDSGQYTTQNLNEAFRTLDEISSVTSLNSKQEILKSIDNKVLKLLFNVTYNNFVQFNIKKVPKISKFAKDNDISHFSNFITLLTMLNSREITGNAAIYALQEVLESSTKEEAKWFGRVIRRDLKIGVAEKGINKAYPGLIPTYEVMLADKILPEDLNLDTDKAYKMLPDRFVCQHKLDGFRLTIFVPKSGEPYSLTRNGKQVFGYSQVLKEAKSLPKGYVYDGEMTSIHLYNWIEQNIQSGGTSSPNRDLFSEAMSHAFSKETNKKGIYSLYDMVPIKEWEKRESTETLSERYNRIRETVSPTEHIVVVPTTRIFHKYKQEDLEEVVRTFHEYIDQGFEGLMIKDVDAVYEFKRTKKLIKMKLMDTIDLPVVQIYEGDDTTKYVGMMGGAYVDYKGYLVGVGSGWSDKEREYYWKNPNELIGKTIEIAYQAETTNKQSGLSLSFPVKKSVREDK